MDRSNSHSSTNVGSPGYTDDVITDTLPKMDYYRSLRDGGMGTTSRENITGGGTISRTTGGTLSNKKSAPIFKPSGKNVSCIVVMLDGTEEKFEIDKASYGQQLFEVVCQRLDLIEQGYFCISYRDKSNVWHWLDMETLISKQVAKTDWYFEFRVRFYPYDMSAIVEDLTRYFICLQVRQDIITGTLRCSFLTYVILGAYVVQSEAGDHDPSQHVGVGYIRDHPFAPSSLQTNEMLERIAELHRLHRGQTPEEADMNFLNNANKLSLYGIDFHKSVDGNSGQEVTVGVYYGGLVVHRGHLRLRRYSWAKIFKLSYKGKEFHLVVRPGDGEGTANRLLVFKCASTELSKRLWLACVQHHAFFRLREVKEPKRPTLMPGFGTRTFQPPVQSTQQQVAAQPTQRPQPCIKRTPTQRKNPPHRVQSGVSPGVPVEDPLLSLENPVLASQDDVDYRVRPVFPMEQWTWSTADSSSGLGINEEALDTASQEGAGWQGVRANKGIKGPGRYFYEASVLENGPVLVGWASNDATLAPLASDKEAWALGFTEPKARCRIQYGGQALPATPEDALGVLQLKAGDVIGSGIEMDPNGSDVSLQWFVNGKSVLKRDLVVQLPDHLRNEALFPAVCMKDSRILANFGDQPFIYGPAAVQMHSPDKAAYVPLAQAQEDLVSHNRIRGLRMNPYDATSAMDVSSNRLGLQAQSKKGWQGCRANQGVFGGGKYYYEATVLEGEGGLARIGWATQDGDLDLGTDQFGFGYGADKDGFGLHGTQGKKTHSNEIENYGEAFTKDDVIGCALDLNQGTVAWSKNGQEFGVAFKFDPKLLDEGVFFPTASLKDSTVEFNFGEKPFHFPSKTGDCIPLCFSAAGNTKETRRHGPQRKKCGWSYVDPTIMEEMKNNRWSFAMPSGQSTDRHEESYAPSTGPGGAIRHSKMPPGDSRNSVTTPPHSPLRGGVALLPPSVGNEMRLSMAPNGTPINTNKIVTHVEEGEPEVTTETYIDEHGNRVTRTVKKTRIRTTMTTSGSTVAVLPGGPLVASTDRAEYKPVARQATMRVRVPPQISEQGRDDEDDRALNAAILAVTGLDHNCCVLTESQLGKISLAKNVISQK